jgi:hypothetical protein
MKLNLVCVARSCAVLLLACGASQSAPAADAIRRTESTPTGWRTVDLFQTNQSPRLVTNLIEVRVPNNVIVTEYRTNWFERALTNVINVVVTNWSNKTITNTVAVNLVRTNVVDRYQTNWTTLAVTNRATFNLTNWETVMVTKTNRIHQPMTNFVEVNVPVKSVVIAKEDATRPEAPPAETTTATADALVMDAGKTTRPYDNNGVEVIFRVRLSNDAAAPLEVAHWRVERDDGAVLFSAQTQEFSRRVPTGRYVVEIKARRSADSPVLALKTVLDVTRDVVARR